MISPTRGATKKKATRHANAITHLKKQAQVLTDKQPRRSEVEFSKLAHK